MVMKVIEATSVDVRECEDVTSALAPNYLMVLPSQ